MVETRECNFKLKISGIILMMSVFRDFLNTSLYLEHNLEYYYNFYVHDIKKYLPRLFYLTYNNEENRKRNDHVIAYPIEKQK